jgi:hypothetical protein
MDSDGVCAPSHQLMLLPGSMLFFPPYVPPALHYFLLLSMPKISAAQVDGPIFP